MDIRYDGLLRETHEEALTEKERLLLKEREIKETKEEEPLRISCEKLRDILDNLSEYPNVDIVDIRKTAGSEPFQKGIIRQYLNLEEYVMNCDDEKCTGTGYDERGINEALREFFKNKKKIVILMCRTGAKSFSIVSELRERKKDNNDPLYEVLNAHHIMDVKSGSRDFVGEERGGYWGYVKNNETERFPQMMQESGDLDKE